MRYIINNTIKRLDINITNACNVMSLATNWIKVDAIHVLHVKKYCTIAIYMVSGSKIQIQAPQRW